MERVAAKIIGGKRYPANTGGPVDAESDEVVAQVKNVKVLSLHELERIAKEMRLIGLERGKVGIVLVKRKSGKGKESAWLAVMAV
jgi:predicted RNase H-like nuclease (RuvC/YqgF family)